MPQERTPQSDYLLRLGRRILAPYTRLASARAAMVTGSVAEEISDHYSDLDMTVYYEGELPSEETRPSTGFAMARRAWFDEVHGAPQ